MSNIETKKALIKAAKQIIKEKGLDGLNARAITKKAGFALGSLYNYFESMCDLILLINYDTLKALKTELKKAVQEESKKNLGLSITKRYLHFARKHLPFWTLIYEYKLPKDQKIPEWYQQLVMELFQILEDALTPHLSDDKKSAKIAARVIWAGFHGILMLEITGKLDIAHHEPAEVLCESLFEHYLRD